MRASLLNLFSPIPSMQSSNHPCQGLSFHTLLREKCDSKPDPHHPPGAAGARKGTPKKKTCKACRAQSSVLYNLVSR